MKNLPSNIAVFIILGLTLVIIGVLAALHVAIPDVVSTVALVAAGGGAGLSLPAVQALSYTPTPTQVAPLAPPVYAAPTPAPVYAAPAPAPVYAAAPVAAAPVVSSSGGVTSTYPAPTAPGE